MAKRELVGEGPIDNDFSGDEEVTYIDVEGSSEKPVFETVDDAAIEIDIGDDEPKKEAKQEEAPVEAADEEIEIEIEDDTPKQDRGRKKSDPPEEVSDEELAKYSKDVQSRIKHFTKGYHDERREKEAAQRQLEEMQRYAQNIVEQNKQLKGNVGKTQSVALDQAKRIANSELEAAKAEYRDAYEAGNADAVVEAQTKLVRANAKIDRIAQIKLPSLQEEAADVQGTSALPQQRQAPEAPKADEKAVAWSKENTWFGSDEEMTAFALGYHQKLVKSGVDANSDEYYEKLNSRMRKVFPEEMGEIETEEETPKPVAKSESVVAPASRSQAPKRIKLTKTQVQIAKRLNVPLEMYAKQVAEEMRKANNG